MNYERIYNEIIENRRLNPYDGITEKHHIIPKSMGGGNNLQNIVKLSLREHYLCHYLLTKFTTGDGNFKMVFAFNMMNTTRDKKCYNSILYESNRIKFTSQMSSIMSGENHPCFGKFGAEHPAFGTRRNKTQEQIQSVIDNHADFSGEKNPMYGKHHSKESKLQNSLSNSGDKHSQALIIHIFNNDGEFMYESNGNFKKICEENKLPFRSLKTSYQNNGKKLSRINNSKYEPFKGWYAIKIDKKEIK